MFADRQFTNIHHEQHQHEVDAVVFELAQRRPPAHAESLAEGLLALVAFRNEDVLGYPHLNG